MKILKNADIPVLEFDLDDQYIRVLNNRFLPYGLKDYIQTSDFSGMDGYKKSASDISTLRDWISNRTLNLSRTNAKQILNASSFPQSANTKERIQIALACDCLSMTDNFWTTEPDDNRAFAEVCLRNHHLEDAAYAVSILGKNISVNRDILKPDIGTNGMFAKTWVRTDNGIYLWKTDFTTGFINTEAELLASRILDTSNVPHVSYKRIEQDGLVIASCPCICSDMISTIDGYELRDWCEHTGRGFFQTVLSLAENRIADMAVVDYVFANTDRHLGNILFFVDNTDNQVLGPAPLFDHNQTFIADYVRTDISDCIYELTGKTMKETATEFAPFTDVCMDYSLLPEEARKRAEEVGISNIEKKQKQTRMLETEPKR